MLKEEFETWPADYLPDTTLVIIGMYVNDLDYLENELSCFTELPNGGTEEANRILVGLDTAGIIPEIDNQNTADLNNLEVKRENNKKEKVERCR